MLRTDFALGITDGQIRRGQVAFRNVVLTLVERGGSARSFHVDGTTVGTLIPIIRMNIRRESELHTDEASWYRGLKGDFARHEAVNHQADEYVRGTVTTNTVEGFYSIFKRGMKGVYRHCAEKHLHRYLAKFDFRDSNRVALGCDDGERAEREGGSSASVSRTIHIVRPEPSRHRTKSWILSMG